MENDSFFQDVYQVVELIPAGKVTTYGAIARYLNAKSARAVGWALNALPPNHTLPAHRVVNASGHLTGAKSFSTPTTMLERLTAENIPVEQHRIQSFEKYFWDPSLEL